MSAAFIVAFAVAAGTAMSYASAASTSLAIDARVQTHATASSTIATSPSLSTTGAGRLLVAFVAADGPSTGGQYIKSVSGAGLTWRRVARANAQAGDSEIWQAWASSQLTSVRVSATLAYATLSDIVVMAFRNARLVTTPAAATANAGAGAPQVSVGTTTAGSMVYAVGNDWDQGIARTPAAGQTVVDQYMSPWSDTFWVQQVNTPTATAGTATTVADTAPTSDRWNYAAMEVVPSTAATTTTTTTAPASTTTAPTSTTAPSTTTTAPSTTTTSTTTTAPSTTTTSTTVPPTTAPPTTTAPTTTFPSASTTGVPAGTTLTASGSIVVSQAGTVIDAKDVSGVILVNASNVTIKRTRVRAGNDNQGLILIGAGVTNTTVQDSEVDGLNSSMYGITSSYQNDHLQVVRTNIHGLCNGLEMGPYTTLQDSYIHDLAYTPGGCHFDGIESDGSGDSSQIRHNTISSPWDQTSAIMIDTYFGPQSNITVDSNLLSGGGYALYVISQGHGCPTGVTVTNNHFGTSQFGPVDINCSVTASGNVMDASGAPVNI